MKDYPVSYGYVGFVGNKRMIFPTENEYLEYLREEEEDGTKERLKD